MVIAILAAVTIVAYTGIANRAKASAASSAAQQAAKKVMEHAITNADTYPATLTAAGVTNTDSTSYQYSVNNSATPKTFCITATVTNVSYWTSHANTTPSPGGCPGHGTSGLPAITNLATNPSFEAASGTVEVRRNRITNPSFELDAAAWSSDGSTIARSTVQKRTGAASLLTTPSVNGGGMRFFATGLTIGVTSTFSVYVFTTSAKNIRAVIVDSEASTSGGTVLVPANTWTRLSVTRAVTSADVNLYISGTDSTTPFYADSALFEMQSSSARAYFDGGHYDASDPDLTPVWTVTANASQSILRATHATDGLGRGFSSTAWAKSGARSVRIHPLMFSGNTDSYVSLGGDINAMRLGMEAGKTYTALGTIRLSAAQSGTLNGNARRIAFYYRIDAGAYQSILSTAAPNAAGEHDLRHTFTVPSTATEAFVRYYNGASADNGDVWWDNFMFVEGNYSGNYGDGTSPGWIWNGIPNASTSTGPQL